MKKCVDSGLQVDVPLRIRKEAKSKAAKVRFRDRFHEGEVKPWKYE